MLCLIESFVVDIARAAAQGEPPPCWQAFVFGCIGSVGVEVIGWQKVKHNAPDYVRTKFYWFVTISLALIGGAVACAGCMSAHISVVTALFLGASAPLILSKAAEYLPRVRVRLKKRGEGSGQEETVEATEDGAEESGGPPEPPPPSPF